MPGSGAGIAVGPILGGWATTELSWRIVFAGEVVLVLAILAMSRLIGDAPNTGGIPRLDYVGTALSATGLGAVVLGVLGVLQASTWGWVQPKDSPVEPFGFSLTIFVVALGSWHPRPAPGRRPGSRCGRLSDPGSRSLPSPCLSSWRPCSPR